MKSQLQKEEWKAHNKDKVKESRIRYSEKKRITINHLIKNPERHRE